MEKSYLRIPYKILPNLAHPPMKQDIIKDRDFLLAEQYVENTGASVFLTGKAGTGKTTFLHYIHETTSKNHVILAPTGVAAVNAGGSTIHSFFQLPFDPYLPDFPELKTEYQSSARYKFGRKKKDMIRSLELIIIDEVSMVRADILDAIDMILRTWRNSVRPFGGVQLLLIGDPSQLSPVATANERYYLDQVYPSPYFFHSKALCKMHLTCIELTSVYRQRDPHFIDLLNAVREQNVSRDVLTELNSRLDPEFKEEEGWIRLTTHNATASEFNAKKLAALPTKPHTYKASVMGDFPPTSYPVEEEITLKVGAQVMFTRNNFEQGFYNGKIGTVKALSRDGIVVSTKGSTRDVDIDVPRMQWENIKYEQSQESGEVEPSVVGTFIQFPLRLAWAITIHKSQSLTFDKVIIDASRAFAFGQVYVALSRCTSLEGIVLNTPISPGNIYHDVDVASFEDSYPTQEVLSSEFSYWENLYWEQCLSECFDFGGLFLRYEGLWEKWTGSKLNRTQPKASEVVDTQYGRLRELEDYAKKFRGMIPAMNAADRGALLERTLSAARYYKENFQDLFITVENVIRKTKIADAALKEEIMEAEEEFRSAIGIHLTTLESVLEGGFSLPEYRRAKVKGSCNPSFKFYEDILEEEKQAEREKMRLAREQQVRRMRELEAQEMARLEQEKERKRAEKERRRLQRKAERERASSSPAKAPSKADRPGHAPKPKAKPGDLLRDKDPGRIECIVESLRLIRSTLPNPREVQSIMNDDVLRRIAAAEPHDLAELSRIKGVGKGTISRCGQLILEAVESGVAQAEAKSR